MEKILGWFVSLQHEEVAVLGRDEIANRIPEVPTWWSERFRVEDRLFQDGCPFVAFW